MANAYEGAQIISVPNSAAVGRGQMVKYTPEGQVGPCGATSDQILGVYDLRDNDDVGSDNKAALAIVVQGKAQAFAGAAVQAGDLLVCGTANGHEGYAVPLAGLGLTAGQGGCVLGIALGAAAKEEAVDVLVQPYYYVKGSN